MKQKVLFDQYVDIDKMKAGDLKCALCKREMRAYKKTLDKRLVWLLIEVIDFLFKKRRKNHFKAKEIWSDHNKITDFQKLHYWDLIERSQKSGWWKLTPTGVAFARNAKPLPKEVWVFSNRVLEYTAENMQFISQIEPRWQTERKDWSLDYIPQMI